MKRSILWIGIFSFSLLLGLSFLQNGNVNNKPTQTRAGFTYRVRRGDTLFLIARRFGTTPARIRQINGLRRNVLRVGQRLRIPGRAGRPGAASTTPAQQAHPRGRIDSELLARVIRAEAEGEPFIGQVAVGAVIMNRIQNTRFPNTLSGVIYQPHAFESVTNGTANRPPDASARKAAQSAVQGWDPSGGAIYFFAPAKTSNRFIWSRRIIQRIGRHIFAI